jgi:hypothetical protein
MIKNPNDAMFQFFGAWFSQDWSDDHTDWKDVVAEYVSVESRPHVEMVLAEIRKMLAQHLGEEELKQKLTSLGSYVYAPGIGLPYGEWLQQLTQVLEQAMKQK